MVSPMKPRQRVLVVGSTGKTGTEIIHALSEQVASLQPIIFVFCTDDAVMDASTKERCNGIIQGSVDEIEDVNRAMRKSCADSIILVQNGKLPAALVDVLQRPAYEHVKLISLDILSSSTGKEKRTKSSRLKGKVRAKDCKMQAKSGKVRIVGVFTEFWSFVTCSGSSKWSVERRDFSTDDKMSWNKPRNRNEHSRSMETEDTTCGVSKDSTRCHRSNTNQINVEQHRLVDFVVSALMDSESLGSLGGTDHTRHFAVRTQ